MRQGHSLEDVSLARGDGEAHMHLLKHAERVGMLAQFMYRRLGSCGIPRLPSVRSSFRV